MTPNIPNPNEQGTIIQYSNGDRQIVPNFEYGSFPEYTNHLVDEDDTILAIANQYYRDTSGWILIVEANNILNPVELEVGSMLIIPKKYGS